MKNIFGLAGTSNKILKIDWNDLFRIRYSYDIIECKNPITVKEMLFFEYFGVWEHWLEENCEGKYGLTYNDVGIVLYLESDKDLFLWKLYFEDDKISFSLY